MSNFAKSHGLPTYQERIKERKAKAANVIKSWADADHIVDQVYCDLCNGVAKSEIVLKFKECLYDGQKKSIGYRTATDYINAAMNRLHFDMEADFADMRADLYGKLLAVYNDAMEKNDRYSAIGAITTIMKLCGVGNDKPQTAIQINSDKEGGVTVNFGFEKKDEDKL